MKKLNWGIIGLGNIAQRFSEGFFEVKNANLLAVASRNSSKLEIYKNQFKIEKKFIFNNYEDLLKCKDIDIVYIALPNFLHYQWILKCIEFKKKVLVEMLLNPGKTYSREEIGKISGISQERSIDVMITRLRQKIEINPKNPKYLQTIRGSGYVLWIE